MSKFKKQLPKNLMKTDFKNSRSFTYQIDDTTLSFGLSLDDEKQSKNFLKMLIQAQEDVQKMIDEEMT